MAEVIEGRALDRASSDKLIEHKEYIDRYGEDLPEIRHWKWGDRNFLRAFPPGSGLPAGPSARGSHQHC